MSSDGIYWHELMFYHLKTSCHYRYGLTSHEWEFVSKGVIAIVTQTNNELWYWNILLAIATRYLNILLNRNLSQLSPVHKTTVETISK